jgi:hypothetical protein
VLVVAAGDLKVLDDFERGLLTGRREVLECTISEYQYERGGVGRWSFKVDRFADDP